MEPRAAIRRTFNTTGIDLFRTLKPLAFFPSDPTVKLGHGRFDRATWTPQGPAALRLVWDANSTSTETWGDGAEWLDQRIPELLGLTDRVEDFDPQPGVVRKLWRRFPGLRITASHTLWHDLQWLIPGQRVATSDAARQWAALVRVHGQESPGPLTVTLPPAAETIGRLHYTEFHRFGLERQRADNLRSAARHVPRLAGDTTMEPEAFRRRLEQIPGLGKWTSTNVLTMTCGEPDVVVLGDYGQPSFVTWALEGERVGDDGRMLELLEPYRPHRHRVVRLIMSSNTRPPRHGPRRKNPRIEFM